MQGLQGKTVLIPRPSFRLTQGGFTMKAAIMKISGIDGFIALLSDKTVAAADEILLREFLENFKNADTSPILQKGVLGNWNEDDPSLQRGRVYACISEELELIIYDFTPFQAVIKTRELPTKLISIEDYAEKCGKSKVQIKAMCQRGRIPGAQKIGQRAWAIPENAPYPDDLRLTAGGKYVGMNR